MMAVTLYTSRVVLNILGIDDFGIYDVVGGIVTMFSLISVSMTVACQRFLSFELGKNDLIQLKKVFSTSLTIHIILGVIIVVIAETIGVWFLNTQMNIASERLNAANWVFQCSLFTFFINLISVPYNAIIITHEQMSAFAYISIFEVILKLLIVFILPLFIFDKLKIYAILVMSVALLVRLIYSIYSRQSFEECRHINYKIEINIFKQMFNFAGWNFLGSAAGLLRNNGVNILLNIFFGATVNAAKGIAYQVQYAVYAFVSNFQMAINPQIVKSYAIFDNDRILFLVKQGTRFSYYLLFILTLPILIETETILKLWLKIVPEYTVIFVRLAIIYSLMDTLSRFLIMTMLATGNIKKYQIIVGGIKLIELPIVYGFLKIGYSPEIIYYVTIILEIICLAIRMIFLKFRIHLPIKDYLFAVIGKVLIVTIVALILSLYIPIPIESELMKLLVSISVCTLSSIFAIYYVGISSSERIFLKNKIRERINRYYR
jgi:O-antigen/teichoic acid export membrane protein